MLHTLTMELAFRPRIFTKRFSHIRTLLSLVPSDWIPQWAPMKASRLALIFWGPKMKIKGGPFNVFYKQNLICINHLSKYKTSVHQKHYPTLQYIKKHQLNITNSQKKNPKITRHHLNITLLADLTAKVPSNYEKSCILLWFLSFFSIECMAIYLSFF